MADLENDSQDAAADNADAIALESSTYEIIQNRLQSHGKELQSRLGNLNELRKEVFGSIETQLLGSERITTEHNCVPRDMLAVGNRFLFGYNVHFGLKAETHLSDVFSVYEFKDDTYHPLSLDLIQNPEFEKDFKDIYRYYKNATFAKFFVKGPFLYMLFRVGEGPKDFKSFKWAIQKDQLVYVDNRSDHEVQYPPQQEFQWTRTHRDLHYSGVHPHISIDDRLFVETIGGDLTIKIENNTETGEGIYSEPVDDPDQTLDDAEIFYALIGSLILLKVRPYQESEYRYFVYNEKLQNARRLDSIKDACILLPDDHGLVFSNGYYLQSGESKTFETELKEMLYQGRISSPNGEDYLYIFYQPDQGAYVLLQYNVIEQKLDTPLRCHGFTLFEGGELICFSGQDEPQKHHTIQLWKTPYISETFQVPHKTDSYLNKIGNKDIVRGMAECHEILGLINRKEAYENLYVDLVKHTSDVLDSYFWINHKETCELGEVVLEIKRAAEAAVTEFEKVLQLQQSTKKRTAEVETHTGKILTEINHRRFDKIDDFVLSLANLRGLRGDIISLRDLRYVDLKLVDQLEKKVSERSEKLATRCVSFLLRDDALKPYTDRISAATAQIETVEKVADARKVEKEIETSSSELEMLIDIVSNLKVEDTTQRTAIIDNISTNFSRINQSRAALKRRIKDLMSVEGVAEFNAQIKLLNQGVVNYLDVCDSPEKCDDFLTKLMIQVEELEGRFAEFDEFVEQLTEKREEIYSAFESRKLAIVESQNKRANTLAKSADRILTGIRSRAEQLKSINEINGYFASDLMIDKVRDIVRQLGELNDTVKVDDIQSRLKSIREDTVRQLKDKQELFVDGENIIKLGNRKFTVNRQPLDLTTVFRDDALQLHLTGTNFFEVIEDERLLATKEVWNQEVVSENKDVYRSEYLTYCLLNSLETDPDQSVESLAKLTDEELLAFIQKFMGPRYSEGYVKGVHDQDALLLLKSILHIKPALGLLHYQSSARALAALYWNYFCDEDTKTIFTSKLSGFGKIMQVFPQTGQQQYYINELQQQLTQCIQQISGFEDALSPEAAEYLFHELVGGNSFVISKRAADLYHDFEKYLKHNNALERFEESLAATSENPANWFLLARDWVQAFLDHQDDTEDHDYRDEMALLLLEGKLDRGRLIDAQVIDQIEGLSGSHACIQSGEYHLHFNRFMKRLSEFQSVNVPRFESFVALKKELVDTTRETMRLDEFQPRVLTSFVRNRLLDEVYLPMIGDNLAKQMGEAGEQKRTDLMGLLMLVSPPGYGKTTLMEYIANRLGIIFMKINGPALGHEVTSLDPASAPNAGAREEVKKLNLALEMGDNVMIYLDDIQHCHPEFLQKFISLCDAQRKIEGVYKGETRTYDLRGRKVAVVMAGNPYTESGEKFQIPDMLSNRADIYNLGEVIGEHADAFEMSYLENSITSNPVLNPLSSRSQKDIYTIIQMAQNGTGERGDLEGNYSVEELNEMVSTMKKLIRVRDVILKVNRQYIQSAAQSDDYRIEPAFKLQGSYRNMNRIAEKVYAVMNDKELETLIVSNYENDVQTLTSDTEANLLKFKELMEILTEEEQKRWREIKKSFRKNQQLKSVGGEEDRLSQAILQLSNVSEGLNEIRETMDTGINQLTQEKETNLDQYASAFIERFQHLAEGLEAIQVALSSGTKDVATLFEQSVQSQLEQTKAAPAVPDSNQPATGEIPDKITVVNKIPRSLLNVLETQFDLMQGWMQPLLSTSHAHQAEVQELRELITRCLKDYNALIKRVDDN
ncbi:DNA repair ATPase [Gimesia aquarii]|uniref:ATPase involved in DNA repair n=1 Tax=Gimesia aquarii TaxID=2527964 RepID=A0A517VSM8_9PLAN|nr:DNA repair ATPase [Gimesia aquarii]QDT96012.1 ATPase involved in DNA repair [Gimesia aquarii]